MVTDKVLVVIIADNELKTTKAFDKDDSVIDEYIEEQADDCALSNETFAYCIIDKEDIGNFDFALTEAI